METDRYLEQLCVALDVDPLRRDEIRLEVHLHLRERTEELMRQGMGREEAQERAVQEFGDPEEVAARISREKRDFQLTRKIGGMTEHLLWVGRLFYLSGFAGLIVIFLDLYLTIRSSTPHQGLWILNRQPFLEWNLLPIPLFFCLLHLCLGGALMNRQRWARLAAAFLGTLYLLLFVASKWLAPHELPGYNPVEMAIRFAMAGLGAYTLWLLLHPKRKEIIWKERRTLS